MNAVPQHGNVSPDELRAIGERLAALNPEKYDGRWQTALAEEIGVTPRALRLWLSGDRAISAPNAKLIRIIAAQAG